MDIGDRIKARRRELNLSLQDVATKLGVNKSTVCRYESKEILKLPITILEDLAKVLNCSPTYLMGLTDNVMDYGLVPYTPTRAVKILGKISAGLPLYAEENVEGVIMREVPDDHEYFALRVHGDSMDAARIFDGNLVIVKVVPEVPDKAIAIVRVNGDDATVKRFHRDGNIVQLIPQSTNPEHQVQIYDTKKTKIEIIGQVVESVTQFN